MSKHKRDGKNRKTGPNTEEAKIDGLQKGKGNSSSYNLDKHINHKTIKYLLIFIIPAFIMRTYAHYLYYGSSAFAIDTIPYYLRGYLSDLAIGSIFAIISAYLLSDRRWSYVILSTFWSLAFAGNHEHIGYNFSNINLYFLKYGVTEEFLIGSVFVNTLFLKAIVCYFATIVIVIYLKKSRGLTNLNRRIILSVLAVSVLGVFLPINIQQPQWIQTNVLEDNSREYIPGLFNSRLEYKNKLLDEKLEKMYFSNDLSGSLRVVYPKQKPNILLLILEGLGKDDLNLASNLKQVAEQSILYNDFVLNQRQTIRGLYSLICGSYPNLISKETKSDLIGSYGSKHPCLPEILDKYGYSTVFMQGAGLSFMRKDLFAESAGFKEIYGNEPSWTAYNRTGWGVDDKGLMEAVYKKIIFLQRKHDPWMITVLTSGTHPPYNVPSSFYSHPGSPTWEDAVRYVDLATVGLLEELKIEGILDSTLILITSDEVGHPNPGPYSQMEAPYSFLIAMTPDKDTQLINDLYMQADVAISISDYISMGDEIPFGRSLFRQYSSKRNVLFGDVYTDRIFLRNQNDRVLMCNRQFSTCSTYQLEPKSRQYKGIPTTELMVNEFKIVAEYNDLTSEDLNSTVVFEERNKHYSGSSQILYHHIISAKKGETVYWSAKLRADVNSALLKIKFAAGLRNSPKPIFGEVYYLTPGQLLDFNKTWQAERDTGEILTELFITASAEDSYFIKEAFIHKFVNQSKLTLDMNKIEVLGGVIDRSINLLNNSEPINCLRKAIVSKKSVLARECGDNKLLISPPNLFIGKYRTITARYKIKGVRGIVAFYVDFFDSKNVLAKKGPIKVKSGERVNIELEFRAKDQILGLQPRIAIVESSDDGEFLFNSASIRIK